MDAKTQERFWAKVHRGAPGECWPWTAARERFGYGRLNVGGRILKAHRLAYVEAYGEIPTGLHVRHKCDNPPCCNPAHLCVGTNANNRADAVERGRSKRGDRGHGHKLTLDDALYIRANPDGLTDPELDVRFGLSRGYAGRLRRGRTWAYL